MNEKDIRRLGRKDLLKIIVRLSQENDALKEQIDELGQRHSKQDDIEKRDIDAILAKGVEQLKEAEEKCKIMLSKTEAECQGMKEKAKIEADAYWAETMIRIETYVDAYRDLLKYRGK